MAFGFKNFLKGIRLVPVATTAITEKGDVEVLDSNGKLNYFNGSSASPVVTEAHTATLTNKTIDGNNNTITNISTGSLAANIATTNTSQTLTNKSIDADQNTITNIENADIKAGAAIDRSKLASGSNNHVIINNGSGVLSSEATLAKSRGGSGQDNSSITFPASGTLTTNAGVQTLSNKSFSDAVTLAEIATPTTPASGNGKIYFKSDGFLYQLNDDATETKVGAGSGGINYISNPDFESTTTGYAAYADAAGAIPVDGTGGSPTVTITRSASSPLRGTGSGIITKDAANRQGQGVSYDFTISDADKAMPLAVTFDYQPSSGFVSGDSSDLRVYLYDVTNAQIIQPTPYTIQGGSISSQRFIGTFQTNSDSNLYRLIFHVATTSATAWTFKFDNVQVGPQQINYGSPVTDWTAFTPTGSWISNTTYTGQYRRDGDSIEVWVKLALSGAPTATTLTVNLPSGLSIDTNKIDADSDNFVLGLAYAKSAGNDYMASIRYSTATAVQPVSWNVSGARVGNATISQSLPATFTSGDEIHFSYRVPILGWSSVVEMSNDTDTRVVTARYSLSATQSISSATETAVNFDAKSFDTHSATTSTSPWTYTVPVSGYYEVSTSFRWVSAPTGQCYIILQVNGSGTRIWDNNGIGSVSGGWVATSTVSVKAGDTLRIIVFHSTGANRSLDNIATEVYVQRLTGPSSIAASETIAAQYRTNSGTITNSVENTVVYTTKDFDTHGAYNNSTGIFTAPSSGIYEINATVLIGGTEANNNALIMYIRKNGTSTIATVNRIWNTSVDNTEGFIQGKVQCIAGDTIDIRLLPVLTSPAYDTTAGFSIISINRI